MIPNGESEEEIPALLPTSQVDKYEGNRFIDTVLITKGESRFFGKDTIIDLKNIQWDMECVIKQAIRDGKLKHIGMLEDNIISRIETAIRNAITLSQMDIRTLLCDEI